MSVAPMQICGGCRKPKRGPCEKCSRAKLQAYDRQRGTASQRGYGARWSKYRAWFLENWPLCGDRPSGDPTGDSECLRQKLPVPANVVDHIVPVTGPDDPGFYRSEGLQSLCARCHDAKRQRESVAARKAHAL